MGPIGPIVAMQSIAIYKKIFIVFKQAKAGTELFTKSVQGMILPKE
jgi:hypothetical protein